MPRSGMTVLIDELRRRCDAGTADYSDDALQTVLDGYRSVHIRRPLLAIPAQSDGSAVYNDYYWSSPGWVEAPESGSAVWRVEDSAGSVVGTAAYTVESRAGHLRFSASTGGSAYALTFRAYDMDRAAADVWDSRAAAVADRFDVSTDNHDLKRSQLVHHYREMAASYRRRAPALTSERIREDISR